MENKKYKKKKHESDWHNPCACRPLFLAALILISLVTFFFPGCVEKKLDDTNEPDNTLYIGTYQKPEPFIYPMITGTVTLPLMDIVFSRLATAAPEGKFKNMLAENWEAAKNGKKYTLHLRKGVRFHDGVELTSRDIAFSLNWFKDPARSNRSYAFSNVEEIKVIDDYTLEITLKEPDANFPLTGLIHSPIYPAHLFSEVPTQQQIEKFGKHPVGTGPYQFVSWTEDDTLTLAANPDYFEGLSRLSRVAVKTYPNKLTMFNAFVRGDVDFIDRIDSYDYETIREDAAFQTVKELAPGGYALQFNFKSPVTSDLNVRRAISLALRRNEMIEVMEKGYGEIMDSPFTKDSWARNPELKREGYEPEKAIELLKASGWKMPARNILFEKEGKLLRIKLVVERASSHQMRLAKVIRQQLQEIGAGVDIMPVDGLDQAVPKLAGTPDWEAVLFTYKIAFHPAFSRHYLESDAPANFGIYQNSKLDNLFEKAEMLIEKSNEQEKTFWEIDSLVCEDVPLCFLYSPYIFTIASERVRGFDENYLLSIPFMGIRDFKK